VGDGAGAAHRAVGGTRWNHRAAARRARQDELACHPAGAVPRARRREHAGGAGRDGLHLESGRREAAQLGAVPAGDPAAAGRRRRLVPCVSRRPPAPAAAPPATRRRAWGATVAAAAAAAAAARATATAAPFGAEGSLVRRLLLAMLLGAALALVIGWAWF